jgi:hypothetical protein
LFSAVCHCVTCVYIYLFDCYSMYMLFANKKIIHSIINRQLRIDRNFCSVDEEITSIRLYTPCNPRRVLCTTWLRLFRITEQIISINPYKLIQTFFVMILKNIFIFFKIKQIIGNKYRLIHGHFHIGLVIIPRSPYWPETESRTNMGRGMITRPIWKCPYIKLFITYFRQLEKRHPYWPRYGNDLVIIQ